MATEAPLLFYAENAQEGITDRRFLLPNIAVSSTGNVMGLKLPYYGRICRLVINSLSTDFDAYFRTIDVSTIPSPGNDILVSYAINKRWGDGASDAGRISMNEFTVSYKTMDIADYGLFLIIKNNDASNATGNIIVDMTIKQL